MKVEIKINKASVNIQKSKKQIGMGATYTEKLLANDYETLKNKPSIEGVELIDDKTFEELGLEEISNIELKEMFDKIFN